jgi:hypothetical protein
MSVHQPLLNQSLEWQRQNTSMIQKSRDGLGVGALVRQTKHNTLPGHTMQFSQCDVQISEWQML